MSTLAVLFVVLAGEGPPQAARSVVALELADPRWTIAIDGAGCSIEPQPESLVETDPAWTFRLGTREVGRLGAATRAELAQPLATDTGAVLPRAGWVEHFELVAHGVRQSWTVTAEPPGREHAPLWIGLSFEGGLVPTIADGGGSILFRDASQAAILRYVDLRAWDARGEPLTAHIRPSPWGIGIEVDDARAVYPVTVDPVTTSATWSIQGGQFGGAAAWRGTMRGGTPVSTAGDVNGDGFSDILVGFPMHSPGGVVMNAGRVQCFYGSPSGPATSHDWMMEGAVAGIRFGASVSCAGDLNSDGYDDVIVSAPGTDSRKGAIHIWLGSASGLGASGTLVTAPPFFTRTSTTPNESFGHCVAPAGDVDGDGFDDVVIGAPGDNGGTGLPIDSSPGTTTGRVYVLFGDTTASLAASLALPWNAQPASLDSDSGFGWSVASAGDIQGNGFSDIVVSAPWFDCGRVYVYNGSANFASDFASDWEQGSGSSPCGLGGGGGGDHDTGFGFSVAGVGDTNGDGFSDVLVGHPWHSSNTADRGRAILYRGSAGNLSQHATFSGPNGSDDDTLGWSVSALGDIDGDGYSDAATGLPWLPATTGGSGTIPGFVWVYQGSASGLTQTQIIGFSGGGHAGAYLSGAGDVDGDGLCDLIVGSWGSSSSNFEGRATLHLGRLSTPGASVATSIAGSPSVPVGSVVAGAGFVDSTANNAFSDLLVGSPAANAGDGLVELRLGALSGLSGIVPWTSPNLGTGAAAGTSVSAGDANNDGHNDVLIGAPLYDNGQTNEGRAVLFLGTPSGSLGATPAWSYEIHVAGANLGAAVAFVGDVNGDGFADAVVGANRDSSAAVDAGSAYLFLGSSTGLASTPIRTLRGQAGWRLGSAISTAGDVNRDGFSDLLIGSPRYSNGQIDEGRVDLYLGNPYGITHAPNAFPELNLANEQIGARLAAAGDVNNDGASDVLLGAPVFNAGQGRVLVYHGVPNGTPSLALVLGITLTGPVAQLDGFGSSFAGAGDVNGDSFADVVVGSPLDDSGGTDRGAITIFYGSSTGIVTSGNEFIVGTVNSGFFGTVVTSAGDMNADGFGDVASGQTGGVGGSIGLVAGGGTTAYRTGTQQRRIDDVSAISLLGTPETTTGFQVNGYTMNSTGLPSSPMGRELAFLQWETKGLATLFDGTGLLASGAWGDTSAHPLGTPYQGFQTGLSIDGAYHWRSRFRFRNPFLPATRWITIPGNAREEKKFGTGLDCNQNGVPDSLDVANLVAPDCNANLWPDACDLSSGFEDDWDSNLVPDSCDIATNPALDCNANGILDGADVANATSPDCNGNVVPDECDIAASTSQDQNNDDIPDECQFFITVFCPGDGFGTACPCGNSSPGGAGEGCLNSLGSGGRLRSTGIPSLSSDTIALLGTQMPSSSALYFQGTTQAGVPSGSGAPFGDGLRCAAGSITRLGTKTNVAGASQYPEGGDLSVSVRGAVTVVGNRTYQIWYRNAAAFCTASTFNLTNGLQVAWVL